MLKILVADALVPEGFVSSILTDITTWLGDNVTVIGGLLALSIGIGFAARAFRKARTQVPKQGGKI